MSTNNAITLTALISLTLLCPLTACPADDGGTGDEVGMEESSTDTSSTDTDSTTDTATDTTELLECDPKAGNPCCTAEGQFADVGTLCGVAVEQELTCTDSCQGSLNSSFRDQFCSGSSAACDGEFGLWSEPQIIETCAEGQACVATGDNPGCVEEEACLPCSITYSVPEHGCDDFTTPSMSGLGGGDILSTCLNLEDSQTGLVEIKVQKMDGSNFSNRPYKVYLSGPNDPPCGPGQPNYVLLSTDPDGIGSGELTFSGIVLEGEWPLGEVQQAVCVTASTVPGDVGFDDSNPDQDNWWWGQRVNVDRTQSGSCP